MSRNTYGILVLFKAASLFAPVNSFSSFHRCNRFAIQQRGAVLPSFLAFMMVLMQFRGNTRKHFRKVASLYLESGQREEEIELSTHADAAMNPSPIRSNLPIQTH